MQLCPGLVILSLLVCLAFSSQDARSEFSKGESEESHEAASCARAESARQLIENARIYKRKAFELQEAIAESQLKGKRLIAQAKKLSGKLRKLDGKVEESTQTGQPLHGDLKQYELHLKEFQDHAKLYNGHLTDYESQVHKIEAQAGELKTNCSQYADHINKFHIPGVRAPHICVQLQWEEKDMQRAAREFQSFAQKAARVEAALARQESQLAAAAKRRAELENKLLYQAELDELERSKGVLLLKEYEAIQREYRNLQAEHKRLLPGK